MGAKPSFEYLNMNYILHNFEYYVYDAVLHIRHY